MSEAPLIEARAAAAAMRTNLYLFLVGAFAIFSPGNRLDPAPYLEAICRALQDVLEGRERRLIISVAPRHLKSVCASVLFPAFLLGHDPTRKIVVVSYGGDLAREQAEIFRRLVESDLYRRLFPATRLDPRHNRIDHMKTTRGGGRQAVSLGGSLTGFGADYLILDDLVKAMDVGSATIREQLRTFFDQTAHSRLNDKRTGAIVSVQQRLHADDITAYLLEKETFRHLCLPSIADAPARLPLYANRVYARAIGDILNPAREPKEVLDQIRDEIGSYAFHAQYLQDPRPGNSAFLGLDDLTLVGALPDPGMFVRRIQSWDTAAKDGPRCDYTAGLTFGWHRDEARWYLLDVLRDRLDYTALKDRVQAYRKLWRAEKVLIEDSAMGGTLLQELRKAARGTYVPIQATHSKVERFIPVTDWLKKGRLVIPTDVPWFDVFRRELLAFPHDTKDQVDALVQFAHWLRRHQGAFLDTDPATGRRIGNYRPNRRARDADADGAMR